MLAAKNPPTKPPICPALSTFGATNPKIKLITMMTMKLDPIVRKKKRGFVLAKNSKAPKQPKMAPEAPAEIDVFHIKLPRDPANPANI